MNTTKLTIEDTSGVSISVQKQDGATAIIIVQHQRTDEKLCVALDTESIEMIVNKLQRILK